MAGITRPLSRSIAWPAPNWLAACIRSLTRPPPPELPPDAIGEEPPSVDGSPRIGYVPPAPGSNPVVESIGTSLGDSVGLPMPGVSPAGLVSAGLSPAAGVVGTAPGVVIPGVVGGNPGFARAGLVSPGLVSPGLVNPGLVRPGLVKPGLVKPGLVRPEVPKPGLARPGALAPVPLKAGTGGKLIPNCDRPCDSAPISSPGRSDITAAFLNSWCSAGLLSAVDS